MKISIIITLVALDLIIVILISTCTTFLLIVETQEVKPQEIISFAMIDLSFDELTVESDLIIRGKVIDKKQAKGITFGKGIPLINNEIEIFEVIKGTWKDRTINVITEGDLTGKIGVEDAAELDKNEYVYLFLYKEPVYHNEYVLNGKFQGKFHIDDNNQVENIWDKEIIGLNTTQFENRIYKILGINTR